MVRGGAELLPDCLYHVARWVGASDDADPLPALQNLVLPAGREAAPQRKLPREAPQLGRVEDVPVHEADAAAGEHGDRRPRKRLPVPEQRGDVGRDQRRRDEDDQPVGDANRARLQLRRAGLGDQRPQKRAVADRLRQVVRDHQRGDGGVEEPRGSRHVQAVFLKVQAADRAQLQADAEQRGERHEGGARRKKPAQSPHGAAAPQAAEVGGVVDVERQRGWVQPAPATVPELRDARAEEDEARDGLDELGGERAVEDGERRGLQAGEGGAEEGVDAPARAEAGEDEGDEGPGGHVPVVRDAELQHAVVGPREEEDQQGQQGAGVDAAEPRDAAEEAAVRRVDQGGQRAGGLEGQEERVEGRPEDPQRRVGLLVDLVRLKRRVADGPAGGEIVRRNQAEQIESGVEKYADQRSDLSTMI